MIYIIYFPTYVILFYLYFISRKNIKDIILIDLEILINLLINILIVKREEIEKKLVYIIGKQIIVTPNIFEKSYILLKLDL